MAYEIFKKSTLFLSVLPKKEFIHKTNYEKEHGNDERNSCERIIKTRKNS